MTADKVKVSGAPIDNCLHILGLNVAQKPFDDIKVRQAIAYAMPYEDIVSAAAYGRAKPMFGATDATPSTIDWPQPFPYETNLDKAKALLAEAGLADGFETTLSFNLGLADWQEPTALLIQESLAKIGIKAATGQDPGRQLAHRRPGGEAPAACTWRTSAAG